MTLGASTTINSLTFTGTGTSAATHPITIGGAGTLTIAAAVGAYPVNTGIVVQSGSANHTINSNVALGQSQSWTVNGTSTLSVNGQVSGTGALIKAGSGTLVLSTADTYSGATNITGGTLRLANSYSSLPVTNNLQPCENQRGKRCFARQSRQQCSDYRLEHRQRQVRERRATSRELPPIYPSIPV